MNDKSGIAEQLISLPKGGRAVQGLGDTFTPELDTGTCNLWVMLTLPSGRASLHPGLGLYTAPMETARPAWAGLRQCRVPAVRQPRPTPLPRQKKKLPSCPVPRSYCRHIPGDGGDNA
jgi:hypothetical protein